MDSDSIRLRGLVSLLAASVVGGAVLVARIVADASWPIAIAIGVLVALATLGGWLWWDAPDRQQAKASLGTGLLVSVVVAGAVGGTQFAIDARRRDVEHQQTLRLTVGREDLRNIDLSGEDLKKFYFGNKRLQNADLSKADLSSAVLDSADLRGADLSGATLTGADLGGANLSATPIDRVSQDSINLAGADLTRATLRGADLTKAELKDVTLTDADLREATLNGVVLSGDYARVNGADLRGADLRGADLRMGTLDGAKLKGTQCDSHTQWPRSFNPAAAGAHCR